MDPATAILPRGWEKRVIRLSNTNTGGAVGLCVDVHDLALSKYAAGRPKDIAFNRALARYGIVGKRIRLVPSMPLDDARTREILARIKAAVAAARPRGGSGPAKMPRDNQGETARQTG